MTWQAITQLILLYGLPLALKLADKWGSTAIVTDAEKQELAILAANTPRSILESRLVLAGIPLESPEAKALLSLLPVNTPLPGT